MKWIKQHTDSDFHPQLQLAGFWGARVFEVLCRISGQYDLEGRIPAQHLHPELLAKRLQATDILPLPEAAQAISDAIQRLATAPVNLISLTEDGGVEIDGWARIQAEKSTERVRRHRERKAAAKSQGNTTGCVSSGTATEVEREETVTNVSEPVRNEAQPGETPKRREEEKRGSPSSPAPAKAERRKRHLSEAVQAVRDEIARRTGVVYPPSAFDALETRLRRGDLTPSEALEIARYAASDPFWGGEVKASPSTIFRPKHFADLLAKARAGAKQPPPNRSSASAPSEDVYARLV